MVPVNERLKRYTGNGVTTNFTCPQFIKAADIHVLLVYLGVEAEVTTGWSVVGTEVVFTVAPLSDTNGLTIYRVTDKTRLEDFIDNDNMPAPVVNANFDRLTMIDQENDNEISRAVRVSMADDEAFIIPGAAARAGKILGFDENGAPLMGLLNGTTLDVLTRPPILTPYFQGPNDAAPDVLWPGTTWTDVSWEEEGTSRKTGRDIDGNTRASGTPAKITVTITAGVPSFTIVSGGSGYPAGPITLKLTGTCTTQWVGTATVTAGVITTINTTTPGAGYTSGKALLYDNYHRRPGAMQGHWHYTGAGSGGSNGQYTANAGNLQTGATVFGAASDGTNGTPIIGPETTTAYSIAIKWRRTA